MVMRAVANFGPAELWLVAPVRPSLLVHPEFEQMSHGVENVRERIRVVADLGEALAGCTVSVAFTARVRGQRWRKDWREARDELLAFAEDAEQTLALVFGSEENGLTVEETDLAQELCYLPTAEEHTSINLAMAVGIVLSSLYTGRGSHQHEGGASLVDGAALAYLKAHLKHVLGGQVARGASARRDIEASIERVFSRGPIESRDARAWHMMMRALGSAKTPMDFEVEPTPNARRRAQALERARRKRTTYEAGDGAGDRPRDRPGAVEPGESAS